MVVTAKDVGGRTSTGSEGVQLQQISVVLECQFGKFLVFFPLSFSECQKRSR